MQITLKFIALILYLLSYYTNLIILQPKIIKEITNKRKNDKNFDK